MQPVIQHKDIKDVASSWMLEETGRIAKKNLGRQRLAIAISNTSRKPGELKISEGETGSIMRQTDVEHSQEAGSFLCTYVQAVENHSQLISCMTHLLLFRFSSNLAFYFFFALIPADRFPTVTTPLPFSGLSSTSSSRCLPPPSCPPSAIAPNKNHGIAPSRQEMHSAHHNVTEYVCSSQSNAYADLTTSPPPTLTTRNEEEIITNHSFFSPLQPFYL